jgi:type III pantothenate kinase
MVIAVIIGNAGIEIGGCQGNSIAFIERLSSETGRTALEYAVLIKDILDIHGVSPSEITGGIVASVVPLITERLIEGMTKLADCRIITVGPGVKTGLSIVIDNPAQLGADLAAGAVAAIENYGYPAIIFSMGTAISASVIDKNRNFIGGIIMPGVYTSLNALSGSASLLQSVALEVPKSVIGKNTVDCMKSGLVFGAAAGIDGIIDRVQKELGYSLKAVAAGENASMIVPLCSHDISVDQGLLIKGLIMIYNKNT